MNLRKGLISFGLAFALLLSAIPAVPASATSSIIQSEKIKTAACVIEIKVKSRIGPYSSREEIPNKKEINSTMWYLKGVESWKGEWWGLYEGWVCDG